MKKLFLLLIFASSLALAADPVVVVNSFSNVTVNGSPAGTVVDVLANVNAPNIRARLFDALLAYEAQLIADATAVQTEKANKAITTAEDAKAAAEQASADAVSAKQAAESAANAETARVAAIVTALKGVAPTLLPANVRAELLTAAEKERAALVAQKAEIEAKLAANP